MYPGTEVANMISSITSTNIRKVTFVQRPLKIIGNLPTYGVDWKNLDDPLCWLVDRSGHKHVKVEVDFRFTEVGSMEVDKLTGEFKVVRSLAKFREKGRIRVVWVDPGGSESVVYSSGG